MEQLMTTQEVAILLQVSTNTIYREAARGKLKKVKVGGLCRYRGEDVQLYIAEQEMKPAVQEKPMAGIQRFKYVPGMKVV